MPGCHPLNAMTGAVTIALVITTSTTEAQNLTLTLTVRNDARVEDAVLAKAQATVAKIYSQAGVDVVWLLSGAQLTIIMLTRESEMAARMRQIPNAMGYAPGTATAPGRRAYILNHQIDELARAYGAEKTVVLGTVIAHEIGHLLFLPGSRSAIGLMRSKWSHFDFQSARNGELLFTIEQRNLIRTRIGGR